MSKFYAVRHGNKIGIFNNWDECKKSVEGFSNAEYKSFKNLNDAKKFLNSKRNSNINKSKEKNINQLKSVKAYVDGSYSKQVKKYAYGCVLINNKHITRLSGVGESESGSDLWNVSGELHGAMKAIAWSIKNGFEEVIIYYDYEGIEKWSSGDWKANKEETKRYVSFLEECKRRISIEFVKVKAHSGDKYNEEADNLAKKALNNDANKELYRKEDSEDNKMISLFKSVIEEDVKVKNPILFNYNGYNLTENKLKKFAKEYWKMRGNKVKEIESLKVDFNFENGLLNLKYIKKDGSINEFKLNI